jgi:hypothetical protein
MNRKNRLPFHFVKIGRYWDKTTEIDIMATGARQGELLLGECKYRSKEPLDEGDIRAALAKWPLDVDSTYWYFFSRSGFTKGAMERADNSGGRVVLVDENSLLT